MAAVAQASEAKVDWTLIFDRVKGSIVFVLLEPMQDKIKIIQGVADRVKTVMGTKKRCDLVKAGTASTGFFVGSNEEYLFFITCAHGLDHLFKASDPLTEGTTDMINATVLCDHYEVDYQLAESNVDRKYANAKIIGADCAHDLLLLAVKPEWINNFLDDGVCDKPHPPLEISQHAPKEAKECMLISWPSYLHRTLATGYTGTSRTVDAISKSNPVGYNMSILEVYMSTQSGSSGAPLFNTSGEVIGMLHGGFGGPHSYFVAARHIRWFLQQNLS